MCGSSRIGSGEGTGNELEQLAGEQLKTSKIELSRPPDIGALGGL
jgi:hypothetical protein